MAILYSAQSPSQCSGELRKIATQKKIVVAEWARLGMIVIMMIMVMIIYYDAPVVVVVGAPCDCFKSFFYSSLFLYNS